MESPADRALELVAARQKQRRAFNERLAGLGTSEAPAPYRCECGLIACAATIRLTADEYAELRADPRHFAVLAGHTMPDAERVLAHRRGWAVVETRLAAPERRDTGRPADRRLSAGESCR